MKFSLALLAAALVGSAVALDAQPTAAPVAKRQQAGVPDASQIAQLLSGQDIQQIIAQASSALQNPAIASYLGANPGLVSSVIAAQSPALVSAVGSASAQAIISQATAALGSAAQNASSTPSQTSTGTAPAATTRRPDGAMGLSANIAGAALAAGAVLAVVGL
ncbi:hypothetical protein FA09DRAFT_330198 [Tilletiopsis washingtonensis]|uniref:Uncharacterized protein n=1 Tax=Tilletiopsis washingtonensis TaxID=58919 RepID=A0A316ZAJ2_9BASI|nr:hypothetical protein FA09DRAFT_330198 [Tilletiopsis washingtonensis]PWN98038.1 hypothetical protein FA09DRAFT_330198 [Tilletiopsis washingtonensis]